MANGVMPRKPAFFNQPIKQQNIFGDILGGAADVAGKVGGAVKKVGSELVDIPSNVADFLIPEAVEDVIGAGVKELYAIPKQASQIGMAAYQFLPEVFINYGMLAINYTGFPGVEKKREGNLFEQFFLQPLVTETTAGQAFNQLFKSAGKDDFETLFGSGFFIAGRAGEELKKAQVTARPTTSGGLTLTPGRFAFGPLTEWGVVEEGSTFYNIGTGLTDVAAYIAVDPKASFKDLTRLPGQVKGMYRGAKDMTTALAYNYETFKTVAPQMSDRLKNYWWGKADSWAARRGEQIIEVLDENGKLIRRVRTERATEVAQRAAQAELDLVNSLDSLLVVVNDSEFRLTQLAPEVQQKARALGRQEGAMFHGSKLSNIGELYAIDDPRNAGKPGNLVGPGLYESDNTAVTMSEGYFGNEGVQEWMGPVALLGEGFILPPGMTLPAPLAIEGEEARGSITRFKWKDGYEPKVLDADLPLPREVAAHMIQKFNLPPINYDLYDKVKALVPDGEDNQFLKSMLEESDLFGFLSPEQPLIYKIIRSLQDPVSLDLLSNRPPVYVPYPGIGGFLGIRGPQPDVFTQIGNILKSNADIITPREIAEINYFPNKFLLEGRPEALEEIASNTLYIDKNSFAQEQIRNNYKLTQKFATEILGLDLTQDARQLGQAYFEKTQELFKPQIPANAFRDETGKLINEHTYQTEIRNFGYDIIKYQGGKRIGGYGEHTAGAIINFDNLEVADILTGERLPVNEGLKVLRENNQLEETVSEYRGQMDDIHTQVNEQRRTIQNELGMSYEKTFDRRTIVPTVFEQNITQTWMQPVLEALANEKDAATIWRVFLRGNAPGLALELSKASTKEEVIQLLQDSVKTLDPNRHISQTPAGMYNGVPDLGFTIKQLSNRFTRQFQTLPENLFIPFDDAANGVKRFDDLAGSMNFPLKKRNQWTTRLMKIYQNGETGAFFDFATDFAKEIIKPAAKRAGLSDAEINIISKFKNTLADVSTFTLQDLAEDAKPWMIKGQEGPIRTSQLMSQGMYLFDPNRLADIIQITGSVGALMRRMENVPIAGVAFKGQRVFRDLLLHYSSEVWKPAMVIGIKHMIKVVPDEILRTLLTGTFESPSQFFAAIQAGIFGKEGAYRADIFGQTFNLSTQIGELELEIQSLKEITAQIDKLRKAGKIEQADELAATFAEDLASYPEKLEKLTELENKFNSDLPKFTDAMIGLSPEKAVATGTNSYLIGDDIRHGLVDVIRKSDTRYREQYVAGVAHETGDMFNNPIFRRVANGKPFDTDKILVQVYDDFDRPVVDPETGKPMKVTKTYAELVASGEINTDGLQGIARWILNGDGKKPYIEYLQKYGRKAQGFEADAPDSIMAYVRSTQKEIAANIGTNPQNLEVLATGLYEGKPAFFKEPTGRWVPSPEYQDFLNTTYIEAADSTPAVRYFKKLLINQNPMMKAAQAPWELWKYMVGKYFQGMYGQTSDLLARSPLWRGAYWDAVEATATTMSKETVKTIRANLETANLPKSKKRRIEFALDQAEARIAQGITIDGETVENIDRFASAYAHSTTKDNLYDASKRSLFGYQHRLLFPFFEAFREQAQVYAKFVAQRPELAYFAGATVNALRKATAIGPGDVDRDGKKEGFLYRNEYGTEVFAIPMTGAIARWLAGTPMANYEISARQMSMIGQVVPGVGFTAQIPLSYFTKLNEPEMSTISEIVFPMGKPQDRGSVMSTLDPRPLWLRRMSPLVAQGAGKIPAIGPMLADFTKLIFGNQQSTVDYKMYYNKVLQAYSTTLPAIKSNQEMQAVLKDVETKTNILFFMRGLTQAIVGSPTSTFMAETKMGDIRVGYLSDKLREYESAAEANGQSRYEGTTKFLEEYGTNVWSLFGNITKSKIPGLQPTEEYDRWAAENKELLATYPLIAGYLGPITGDFSPSAYSRQKYRGLREANDPKQMLIDAQTQMGYLLLNIARASYKVEYLETQDGQNQMRFIKSEISKLYPFWDGKYGWGESASRREQQIKQLEEMVQTKSDYLEQSNIGKILKSYMGVREWYLQEYNTSHPGTDWTRNSKAQYVRDGLTRAGDTLAQMVPQFAFIWQNVLAREWNTDLGD